MSEFEWWQIALTSAATGALVSEALRFLTARSERGHRERTEALARRRDAYRAWLLEMLRFPATEDEIVDEAVRGGSGPDAAWVLVVEHLAPFRTDVMLYGSSAVREGIRRVHGAIADAGEGLRRPNPPSFADLYRTIVEPVVLDVVTIMRRELRVVD